MADLKNVALICENCTIQDAKTCLQKNSFFIKSPISPSRPWLYRQKDG